MTSGWFLFIWLVFTALYHGLLWPAYWIPRREIWTFLVDACVTLLFTGYLQMHFRRKKAYASEAQQWGHVVREEEMKEIKNRVKGFHELEKEAACKRCAAGVDGKCAQCGGKGWVHRPFRISFQRDRVFLGFDCQTGKEVHLQGEAVFRSTLVFGAPGSGKTKRVGHLANRQLFRDPLGSAVFFSLKKGDSVEVEAIAHRCGWNVFRVRNVNLMNLFETWSSLTFGLKMGLKAAGYRSKETFWCDRALALLKVKAREFYETDDNPRLGRMLTEILETLGEEAGKGDFKKIDMIAINDFSSFFEDFMDPISPCRWQFDVGPGDYVPDGHGGLCQGQILDWSMLNKPRQLVIIPPVGASRTGVVAATALKFSIYAWFDKYKQLEPDPRKRRRLNFIQDEGDNFAISSDKGGIDDGYAVKTWREFGYASWCYTQSPEFLKLAMGQEKCRAYMGVVGNCLTFKLPDVEVEEFIRNLPNYEFLQRSVNLNRRSNHYQDHENMLTGNLLVTRGESLSYGRGPWITGEYFQKLPTGCCVLQQAGEIPKVVWVPYYEHVAFI